MQATHFLGDPPGENEQECAFTLRLPFPCLPSIYPPPPTNILGLFSAPVHSTSSTHQLLWVYWELYVKSWMKHRKQWLVGEESWWDCMLEIHLQIHCNVLLILCLQSGPTVCSLLLWLMEGCCSTNRNAERNCLWPLLVTGFPPSTVKHRAQNPTPWPRLRVCCVSISLGSQEWLSFCLPALRPPWVAQPCYLWLEQTLWKSRGLAGRENAAGLPRSCWKLSTNTLSSWIWWLQWVSGPLWYIGTFRQHILISGVVGNGHRAGLWCFSTASSRLFTFSHCGGWKVFFFFFFFSFTSSATSASLCFLSPWLWSSPSQSFKVLIVQGTWLKMLTMYET